MFSLSSCFYHLVCLIDTQGLSKGFLSCVGCLCCEGGSVVICSSFIGYIPLPYIGPYAISKTTLLGLTNILAQSLRPMNIRVNGLALGLINTRFSDVIRNTKELESMIIPIGVQRSGEPEECAGVASFLCSKDASYINGENIAVTGGVLGRL
uniref:Uncharacterized protein n=1 Tax=Leptobrachium leishanense TaxID=445787 RepID=A0A8C5QPD0_9ANUR